MTTSSDDEEMIAVFPAQYPGTCCECGERFEPGTLIRYCDEHNKIIHGRCPEERVVPVCPKCFLTKPCECDD